jgi:hypothetical protein
VCQECVKIRDILYIKDLDPRSLFSPKSCGVKQIFAQVGQVVGRSPHYLSASGESFGLNNQDIGNETASFGFNKDQAGPLCPLIWRVWGGLMRAS